MKTSVRANLSVNHFVLFTVLGLWAFFSKMPVAGGQFLETPVMHPKTQPGQCYSDISKNYITDPQKADVVIYECFYRCRRSDGSFDRVAVRHTEDGSLARSRGDKMLCDGVQVREKFTATGMRIWDFAGVNAFWAFESDRREIREWARQTASLPSAETLAELRAEFVRRARTSGIAYWNSAQRMGDGEFKSNLLSLSAALLEISADSAVGRKELEEVVRALRVKPGSRSEFTRQSMLENFVWQNGRFLLAD